MQHERAPDNAYRKPAIMDLDFEADVSVSMSQNCKTLGSSNAALGITNCGVQIPNQNCQTNGS